MISGTGSATDLDCKERVQLFETVMQRSSVGLCILDEQYRYVYINPALARMNGLPVEAHLGHTVAEVLPTLWDRAMASVHDALEMGDGAASLMLEGPTAAAPDDVRTWEEHWVAAQVDGVGRAIGVICQDVTEATRLQRELETANRHKDVLLATLGHELRNPLAPLRSIGHLLRNIEHPLAVRGADIIERQVAHLVRLADDLMDVSRVQTGQLELRKERVLLSEIIDHAITHAAHAIDVAQQTVVCDGLEECIVLQADSTRLVQLLSNLLVNASKFSPPRRTITVSVQREERSALVRVQDEGRGIDAARLATVFDLFERGVQDAQAPEGLGLGLWLARQIALAHGGSLSAESAGEGCGTMFTLRLPLEDDDMARA